VASRCGEETQAGGVRTSNLADITDEKINPDKPTTAPLMGQPAESVAAAC
jgi:hypothetical protein